jgi:hypothetical protein
MRIWVGSQTCDLNVIHAVEDVIPYESCLSESVALDLMIGKDPRRASLRTRDQYVFLSNNPPTHPPTAVFGPDWRWEIRDLRCLRSEIASGRTHMSDTKPA